ncbi:MAG: competence protein ComEC [Acidobacteriota bacterium]|nr:competence protein ComEC [Acidobacteriota bacterium]
MRSASRTDSFSSRPLAYLAASFACGVLFAHALGLPLVIVVVACALASALTIFAFARRMNALASAFVCSAFLFAGAAHATVAHGDVATDRIRRLVEEERIETGAPLELTGVLARAPEVTPDGFFIELRVEKIITKGNETDASGEVELFAPVRDAATYASYVELELRRGARVRVMTALARAEEFRNPGANSRTEFLERKGFDAAGVIKSPLLVERLDDARVSLILARLDEWRARLHEMIGETFSLETASILQAAMLGNRHGLSRETAESFREGGTFHVLVISGLHIGFLGGLVLWLARRLTRRRTLQLVVSSSLVCAYALAVGAHPSVVRAALMFTFVALGPVVRRDADTLNALGAAALALLIWRPDDLFDPSFQLTFLSVASIAALGWTLLARLREVGAWQPTRLTPHPPLCPRWFRALGETLFWSESAHLRESARNVYDYRLFKTTLAARLERLRLQRALRYAFAAVVVSASVQIAMLPLLVVYFHRIALASVVLNIYVGALMAFTSLAALAAIALAHVSHALAAPLVWAVERAAWLMAHGVDPFNHIGVGSLRLPHYAGRGAYIYVLYYAPLAALAFSLARWRPLELADAKDEGPLKRERRRRIARRVAWVSFASLAVIIIAHPLSAPRADGRLRIDFLDVGQGDSALITLPDGATLLVDGGGRPRLRDAHTQHDVEIGPVRFERDTRGVGDAVVSEFLWWRGLARVDYLLATHAHADHVEGLRDVARNFQLRAAFIARTPRKDGEYARFASAMRAARVPLRLVARGDELRFGAVIIDVLYPSPAPRVRNNAPSFIDSISGASANADANTLANSDAKLDANSDSDLDTGALPSGNDDSIVLRVRYGARCFLLTGDIERGAEESLVAARDDLRCDVVKVAHHGSKTSSTAPFVAATRPAFAVVSVGLDSPFGHPDPSVVARWRAAGAEVLQTGRRGTISFSTDGRDLRVETFVRD